MCVRVCVRRVTVHTTDWDKDDIGALGEGSWTRMREDRHHLAGKEADRKDKVKWGLRGRGIEKRRN